MVFKFKTISKKLNYVLLIPTLSIHNQVALISIFNKLLSKEISNNPLFKQYKYNNKLLH